MIHFNYVLRRADYRKFIYERNKQYNIVYFVIASILYCLLMYKQLLKNPLDISILFIVYIAIIMILFNIYNRLFTLIVVKNNDKKMLRIYEKYKVIVDDEGIYEKGSKNERQTKWDEIKSVKITEDYVMLHINERETIFFRKEHLKGDSKYQKLIEIIKIKTKI